MDAGAEAARPARRELAGRTFDVAVVGGGIAGMATACRLQARGLATAVLEAHGSVGGCAGSFRRRGFSFDVGATTLVDFEPGGVGGEWLRAIGLTLPEAEPLPGYLAWLPDRTVRLDRDPARWQAERRRLGDSAAHRRFWARVDRLTRAFWAVSRGGGALPVRTVRQAFRGARLLGLARLPLLRYLGWTLGDLLRHCGLRDERPLVGLLSMLVEDTVHSTVDEAPLPNAVLGTTIRGAGLSRHRGGMRGFWRAVTAQYRALGGTLALGTPVERAERMAAGDHWHLEIPRGTVRARQVVAAVPIDLTARLFPREVGEALGPYLVRDQGARGSALVVFLGVPEEEVAGQSFTQGFTHHQILADYEAPLGDGNNMFVSVSSPGDEASAPPGHRAVMLSTHCDLASWQGLSPAAAAERKRAVGDRLLALARQVHPRLGDRALVHEVGAPPTYARFTRRLDGAVGGYRLSLANANQRAVPHDLGVPGLHLAGDTTWPGLGTVASVLGSRLVAENVLRRARGRKASTAPAGFGNL